MVLSPPSPWRRLNICDLLSIAERTPTKAIYGTIAARNRPMPQIVSILHSQFSIHELRSHTPMTNKLRVVQVGCGGRAQHHIAAMLACGAVDLVALCDVDDRRLHT